MKFQTVRYFNKDGKLHRKNGPSYIGENGDIEWNINGEAHRTDGPAALYFTSNLYLWYIHGDYYGSEENPPEYYLDKLEELGIPFVRGSDNPEDYS